MNDNPQATFLKTSLRSPYDLEDPVVRETVLEHMNQCISEIKRLNRNALRYNLEASRNAPNHTEDSSFNISSNQQMQVKLAFGWDEDMEVSHVMDLFDPAHLPDAQIVILFFKECLRIALIKLANARRREASLV